MNKLQAAEQLRKALQMFAQTLTDEQAMEIANYILQDPVIRMFGDIKTAEQQADQQSSIN